MRIAVIGASGGTGRQIVTQALGHGHEVSAIVRDPSSIADVSDPNLEVFPGDVLEFGSLDAGIRGSRAVLSVVGTGRGRGPTTVYSDGMHNVLETMDRFVVDRLVCVTAAGVGSPNDPNLPKLRRRIVISGLLRQVYADMERMEDEVMLSEADWTIVRPAGLTDGPLTGEYRAAEGRSLPKGKSISRADVAAFMLKCISTSAWDRKGVAIAY